MNLKVQKKKQYFLGEFEILVNDYSKLYSFFQTKKEYRKKISSINFTVKYDFLKDRLTFEKLFIDGTKNKFLESNIQEIYEDIRPIVNRIDLRNFFNSVIEEL